MGKIKSKKLVIVESPVKAKTISRFLGSEYIVESCMGHIRDLPSSTKELPEEFRKKSWSHFGVNIDDNFKPFYCISPSKKTIVKHLKTKLNSVEELILATDEDREGESIAWHLQEILNPKVPVKRMVFHEITKSAIQEALNNCRPLDNNLVQAQEARRILDRLVGYSISPVLWKNVTRGLSAGRVQSVAVSLVSQREIERIEFNKSFYGGLSANNKTAKSDVFNSHLVVQDGKRLARSSDFNSTTGELKKTDVLLMSPTEVLKLQENLKGKNFVVKEIDTKQVKRKPQPPFITSTLQQECNRKLGFSSKQTMGLAQKLYEQGLITYMRTDSTFLSAQAVQAARLAITQEYGKHNLPAESRVYRTKAKGAQEAHEAIRPSGSQFVKPQKTNLDGPLYNLYNIIWKRTVASQMKDCIQNQVRIKMQVEQSVFQSSGLSVQFAGFYLVYQDQKTEEVPLPVLKIGDKVECLNTKVLQHETKPPAHYTEASLIQKLEKEGVGRPSTYSSIISTIQDRGYVIKSKNTLIPTFTALIVARFLQQNFSDYVDMKFTSEMEKILDDIARGEKDSVKYLKSAYLGSKGLKKIIEVQAEKMKDKTFRSLTLKGLEEYLFNVGPFGAYVSKVQGENNLSVAIPADITPSKITKEIIDTLIKNKVKGGRSLGKDPTSGLEVFVTVGRYGPYVSFAAQATKNTEDTTVKSTKAKSKTVKAPKRKMVSVQPFFTEQDITLEEALKLLELPKTIGLHPDTKTEVKKNLGRFGPYIMHDKEFRSVSTDVFFKMDLKYALQRLSEPKRLSAKVLKDFGEHPDTKKPIHLMKGRYGFYLKYNNANYSVPSTQSKDDLTMEIAINLIANSKSKPKKAKIKSKKKTSVKPKTTKKV